MKFITLELDGKGSKLVLGPDQPGVVHRKAVMDARGKVKAGKRIACFSLTPVCAASGSTEAEKPKSEKE
ncbi:hypothetical protein EBT31_18860 [bacterium]|nr:hypothetical protein [bacterium]